jgi:hypothetical protein
MRHAGGWLLGVAAVLGMAAAGFLGLRPVLFRKLIVVEFMDGSGWKPTQETGVRLAFEEHGFRAGPWKANPEFIDSILNPRPDSHILTVAHSTHSWALLHPLFRKTVPSIDPNRLEVSPTLDSLGAQTARWVGGKGLIRVFIPKYLGFGRGFDVGFHRQEGPAGLVCFSDRSEPQGRSLVDWVLASSPDLVILASNAPDIIEVLRERGFQGRFLLIDPSPYSQIPDASDVDGTLVVSRFAPVPPEFAAKFRASGGGVPAADDYLGYLTANLILDAIDRTGTIDPVALFRSIAQLPDFVQSSGISTLPGALYVVKNGKYEFVELLK